ncbi:hypothetical protein MS3_00008556 [Schistosoma haematobium]|uniref:C2H2-type domain-containing protein n=1 Tax=Schistosoma haematobium TaxID=6185 RepID=A0A922S5C0_SCHHA|nr:hypothetical protein MS3_00008556 [Schistosoma haematobium]KAH9594811.1 hypothetical protein MS3_00008556 [Schistosoma haematobium]
MKFSEDSSGVLHLNSTSNKTVKEYDCQKVGIKHSSVGDVCDVVVSQKNINESKESSSDRQMTFTSAGSHSNHSNLHSSSEYPQKARRSLLDWDSFINLPKKPRNLSLKTDDLSRTLVTKTTDSRSPIKSKQEGDSRASPCLSPIKANDFVGNVKLAPLRCSTEHDKLLTNSGYSSSEEHSKSVPARGGESSDFSSPDFTLSSIPVKNRAETRKRRSSHFATAYNDSEVSSDQLDIHSQRQNQKKILIGNHNSKKRKLSPSVRIRRTKDTFTCIAKENLHNGVQSPDFDFDTGNSIHCQKVSCRSLCGACDHDNHISNELNLRELSGSIASQQNHSLANNSLTITHVATQRPSLRLKKSSKLPKEELISTQNQSNLANKSVFQCLYCTRPFSEKRYRLKHMIACRLAPKNLTKKKLHEIGRMYESSSISSGSPNLVNNVDEEISISNGVICQANQTLQNGHSDEIENTIKKDKNSPENSYQNNPKMNHDVDSKSNPITPFLSTTTNPFINSDDSLKTDRNTLTTNTFDSHLVTKRSENNLSSNNNEPYESDEDIWQNYRPSYGGPYTCSFCYRVIHNRSNFSRHIASCKARISLSTRSTPKPKPAVRRNKRKFHFVFTPTHKVTPQLKDLRKELFKGGISNTELNKVDHRHSNGDTDNNEIAMNSGDKSLNFRGLATLDKNVTALVNSEDSQHDCTDEHLFSTGCHQDNPTEDEQKNRLSPSTSGLETSEGTTTPPPPPPTTTTTTTTATTTMTTTTTTTGTSSEHDVSNENLTATPFKCNMCSLSYRHRTSLLRHARQSNHKVDLIRTRKRRDSVENYNSGIRKSGECLNGGGCMDNEMISNLTWKECSESVTLDSKVVENENIGQVVGEVDHRHSNGDTDNNEIAMNSGDKSLDPRGLSTLDKNVTALVNSEDSQHDCTDEHLFSTGCHQDNPTEDEQKNRLSPSTSGLETSEGTTTPPPPPPPTTTTTTATTTMTTTTTTTGTSSEHDVSNENLTATPFKCNMCSLSYRHRTSLLRHARQSNHKVDLIRTRKRRDSVENYNSGIRKSGECLNGGGCMDNEMISNLTWKECSESVTLDSKVVENENIGQVVGEMKQISETHSSSNNSCILTGKTYSLGLRSRRLSLQSNQSIRNIETPSIISKLNRRKNRSVSPYSLRHPRIEEEISKCRRSSVSTQSLSDNLIDDVRSIISNATTVPASDCNLKINESSSLFTCSWCNRSGFKCWRYLQIHRARCSSHPNRSNKQKSILSTNNMSQVKTSVICEQCNREFRSGTGLKVHQTLMSHHNNKSFIHKNELSNNLLSQSIACPGCSHDSPLFESTEKLLKHLLTLKSTNTTTNTNHHHHHHHTNRSQYWPTVLSVPNLGYGCHICGMLLASESRLDKHKKAVHEVWLFQEQQNISPSKKLSTTS